MLKVEPCTAYSAQSQIGQGQAVVNIGHRFEIDAQYVWIAVTSMSSWLFRRQLAEDYALRSKPS